MDYRATIEFVNEQVAFHERKCQEFHAKFPRRAERHLATAATFKVLRDELATLSEVVRERDDLLARIAILEAAPVLPYVDHSVPTKPAQIGLTFDDIDGLPVELMAELGLSDGDLVDFKITRMVEQAGGVLSLDRILIGLFKTTGEVHKRANLNARIYRMVQRGDLYSVPGKKGVYSVTELSEEQADVLR